MIIYQILKLQILHLLIVIPSYDNLLKEVTELRNECRKFKEELDRSLNEKNAGNKYIRELENEINKNNNKNSNNNNENNNNERNNNFNRYHDMLNKTVIIMVYE